MSVTAPSASDMSVALYLKIPSRQWRSCMNKERKPYQEDQSLLEVREWKEQIYEETHGLFDAEVC